MKGLVLSIGLLCFSILSWGQTAKFHSGFIYHFTKYIEWPTDMRTGDFVIAIVGQNDVIPFLEKLATVKKAGTQKMIIKRCSSVVEAKGAHIIFLSDSKLSQFPTAQVQAQTNNSLLLTDQSGYGKKGAMINFVDKAGRMQFEINKKAIKSTKIKVSEQLLKLAIVL